MLANESKCTKSPWYDKSLPLVNLHTVRDQRVHDNRRKVFSKAFAPSAMKDYEARVVVHCEEFIRQMTRLSGQSFDASAWFKYFGKCPGAVCGYMGHYAYKMQPLMSWVTWVWAKNST